MQRGHSLAVAKKDWMALKGKWLLVRNCTSANTSFCPHVENSPIYWLLEGCLNSSCFVGKGYKLKVGQKEKQVKILVTWSRLVAVETRQVIVKYAVQSGHGLSGVWRRGLGPGRGKQLGVWIYSDTISREIPSFSVLNGAGETFRVRMACLIQAWGCCSGVGHVSRMLKVLGLICSSLKINGDFLFYVKFSCMEFSPQF